MPDTLNKTTKYIVLEVIVEHEDEADVPAICEEVVVFCDAQDGSLTHSKVVGVYDKEPGRKV